MALAARFAAHFEDLLGPELTDPIQITTFLSQSSPVGLEKRYDSFDKLFNLVGRHHVGTREGRMWSPAVFKDDTRSNANVTEISLAVFDVDYGKAIPDAIAALKSAGIRGFVVSTFKHTTETPRFRLVIPTASAWRAANYPTRHAAIQAFANGRKRLENMLGLQSDPNASDPARAFYLPRHPEGAKPESHFVEGDTFDVWPIPQVGGDIIDVLVDEAEFPDWLDEASDEDAEIVRSAIAALPNDARFADRFDWLRVIAAIRHSLGESGRVEAETWSRRWTGGKHNQHDFDRAWKSIKPQYQGRKAGIGTILALAKEAGWRDPREISPLTTATTSLLSAERRTADRLTVGGDTWAGTRHAERFRGKRLHVGSESQWLAWNEMRWVAQSGADTDADAKETTAAILSDAAKAVKENPSDKNRKKLTLLSNLHGSLTAQRRMIDSSRSEVGMSVHSIAEFDTDPLALTIPNGILDLRTNRLRRADPDDRVSKLAGPLFDPTARSPMFDNFLAAIMPDAEHQSFLRRAAGYTATGLVDEEVFFVAHGGGANGKSVFANILAAALGEYVGIFGAALVTKGKHDNEAERMKAALPGKRLALVNETAQGDLWDSARIKELASREKMQARQLYKEPFAFMPSHKLWIRTNHLPGSLDAGDGFWRRCVAIPFTTQIPEAKRIPDLDRRIIASELPGVLNWIVRGAQEWLRDGLRVPATIRAEVATYREETDLLGQWFAEKTISDHAGRVSVSEAFHDYSNFCQLQNTKPGTQMAFGRAMTAKGVKRDPHRGKRIHFMGFRLREYAVQDEEANDF